MVLPSYEMGMTGVRLNEKIVNNNEGSRLNMMRAFNILCYIHRRNLRMSGKIEELFPESIRNIAIYCRTAYEENSISTSEYRLYPIKCYISKHPTWSLKGIYQDYGYSNRELDHLLEECNNQEIHLIITTSISSISRNIIKTIEFIKSLKEINIGVYFFSESIYSMDSKYDYYMDILKRFAEEESRKKKKIHSCEKT